MWVMWECSGNVGCSDVGSNGDVGECSGDVGV